MVCIFLLVLYFSGDRKRQASWLQREAQPALHIGDGVRVAADGRNRWICLHEGLSKQSEHQMFHQNHSPGDFEKVTCRKTILWTKFCAGSRKKNKGTVYNIRHLCFTCTVFWTAIGNVPHVAETTMKIAGYTVPAGSTVRLNLRGINYDPKVRTQVGNTQHKQDFRHRIFQHTI